MAAVFWRNYTGTFITLAQAAIDFISVFIAFWVGYFFYDYTGGYSPQTPREYLVVALGAGLLYITIFKYLGLYQRQMSLLNVEEFRKTVVGAALSSLVFFGVSFYVRSMTMSRVTITVAMVVAFILINIQRALFYRVHLYYHLKGRSQEKVLIYGAGEIGRHLLKRLYQSPALGISSVGFIDDDPAKKGMTVEIREYAKVVGNKVLGTFEDLERIVRAYHVHEVFIAIPSATFEATIRIVHECKRLGVQFAIVPHAYEQFIQKVQVFDIGGIPILRPREMHRSLIFLFFKRIVDFFGASFLILIFSPLYLLFGILIKMDSSGSVIFKQKRVGLCGKEFTFYKFRTMYVDVPKYAPTPHSAQDVRITKVGRWLRRTSLDELPQLFNVLRGDMSLVGPRPEMPFIVATYNELQRERLLVKPGITGVWQISAVRGDPIHANLEYDLYYIEHQSVFLDFIILWKSVFSVIRGIGAI